MTLTSYVVKTILAPRSGRAIAGAWYSALRKRLTREGIDAVFSKGADGNRDGFMCNELHIASRKSRGLR
jgi:hypothetical protein